MKDLGHLDESWGSVRVRKLRMGRSETQTKSLGPGRAGFEWLSG